MAVILPRIDNYIPNPSAALNTTGWAGVTATLTRDTSWGWQGTTSFSISASSAVATVAMTTPTLVADANRVVIAAGSPASLRARVKTAIAFRQARIVVEWRNASSGLISTDTGPWVALTANVEADVRFAGLTAPALTTFASVRIEYGAVSGTLTVGNILLADGIQLSPTETVQTYVQGDLGSGFHWVGASHLSRSWRDALAALTTRARKGVTVVSSELWLANTSGQLLEDITPEALEGKVTVNLNNTIKMGLALSVTNPDAIVPYTSVVAPFINCTDIEGNAERHQLGLFICTPPKHSHRQTYSTGDIEGRDLTWILANDYVGSTYNLATGANLVNAAIALIAAKGLRYNIPADTSTLPAARSWPPDVSKLDIINDLLNGAGYYTLWADRFGILQSMPFLELSSAEPALSIFSGEGSILIDTVDEEGVFDTIANKVIVYKENTQGASIRVTRTNNDPASPVSTVSLGRTITRVIKDTNIASTAVAQAIARAAIEEGSTYTNKLKITTFPMPARALHEVYDLAIYNAAGDAVAFGLWWCDQWELGFTLNSAKMVHNVKRLEPYGWDEVIV